VTFYFMSIYVLPLLLVRPTSTYFIRLRVEGSILSYPFLSYPILSYPIL
jgi:hypothetical protein